jgi:hypothetical protein
MPLLELGVGFRGDMDGWNNLYVVGALLGLDLGRGGISIDEIVEASGVGDSMDQPLKHWSTGMRARLGFALATARPCDVLLIDEVLAVGDLRFRASAIERVRTLSADGTAVVLASHDISLINEVCERVVQLELGRVVADGPATEVTERYEGVMWSGRSEPRFGPVRISQFSLSSTWVATGGRVQISAIVEVREPSPSVRLELALRDPAGQGWAKDSETDRVDSWTICCAVVADEGGFAEPGRYAVSIDSGPLEGNGRVHAILSAIEARDACCIAEAWMEMAVGATDDPHRETPAAFTFEVETTTSRIE